MSPGHETAQSWVCGSVGIKLGAETIFPQLIALTIMASQKMRLGNLPARELLYIILHTQMLKICLTPKIIIINI